MPNEEEYLEIIVSAVHPDAIPYEDQRYMVRTIYSSLSIPGTVQVGQGPTGMGKTAVELAAAKKLTDDEKRVLIAVPSYEQLDSNLQKEAASVFASPVPVWYGFTHPLYQEAMRKCPLAKETCSNMEAKTCMEQSCFIVSNQAACNDSKIVFTVHHIPVSIPSFINNFDAVIIDESHGYPSVIENHSRKTIDFKDIHALNLVSPQDLAMVTKYTSANRTPPAALVTKILQGIKSNAKKSDEKVARDLSFYDKAILKDGKIYLTKFAKQYKHNGKTSIALISATIEDAHDHVRDCGFGDLIVRPACQIDSPYFKKRFEHRPVYALIDGPFLGKADMANYSVFRDAANDIIAKLVSTVDTVTMILCQNGTDALSVFNRLKNDEVTATRVTNLPDDLLDGELSTYQRFIEDEVKKGRNLIIATASSKLWEGANVTDLHFLIIDALPFKRQNPDELKGKGKKVHDAWRSQKRFMLNRVQQGIGRLVRGDDEWGIVIIVDGRFYHGRKQYTKPESMPRFITNFINYETTEKVIQILPSMAAHLMKGGDARVNQRLDDFLN
ncbi:MAG TPA: helicase C-terminal domain-containing protein [Candidatus Lokiarchaeia archaeon]|nr:helicase C-terminal domain-containing protein [Candidatus Lokiarchaeia archaeon]